MNTVHQPTLFLPLQSCNSSLLLSLLHLRWLPSPRPSPLIPVSTFLFRITSVQYTHKPKTTADCTTVVSFIGQNKDIKVEQQICGSESSPVPRGILETRQDVTDLCFVGCFTECLEEPAPGQPTPVVFDCEQIAAALRFEAHQAGTTGPFSIAAGVSAISFLSRSRVK